MTPLDPKALHKFSSHHRASIERGDRCGCFCCGKKFRPAEYPIKEWIDEETTALCPFCGVDAVLSTADVPEADDENFLEMMEAHWFSEG